MGVLEPMALDPHAERLVQILPEYSGLPPDTVRRSVAAALDLAALVHMGRACRSARPQISIEKGIAFTALAALVRPSRTKGKPSR